MFYYVCAAIVSEGLPPLLSFCIYLLKFVKRSPVPASFPQQHTFATAIYTAYEACDLPLVVRAQSTMSMAASKVLLSGISLQEVCDVAGVVFPGHIYKIV